MMLNEYVVVNFLERVAGTDDQPLDVDKAFLATGMKMEIVM